MNKKVIQFSIFIILIGGALPIAAQAQFGEQCAYVSNLVPMSRSRGNEAYNEAVRERLIKSCIKELKKEFAQTVEKTKEIRALSDSINESFEEKQDLSEDDRVKLKRLEDLVDSVRKSLKIKKTKTEKKDKMSMAEAVKSLTKAANELTDEIQKRSRHTVSVITITSTNTVLRLAKFLRLSN